MLLRGIVEALDAELHRLGTLRAIVSGLKGPSAGKFVAQAAKPSALAEIPAAPELAIGPKPGRVQQGRPKRGVGRRPAAATEKRRATAKPEADPKALTAAIPRGPVVVSAAALAKERQAQQAAKPARKAGEPQPEPGSLGSRIRALRLDTL